MAAGDKQGSVWVPSSCWAPQQPHEAAPPWGPLRGPPAEMERQ